MWGLILSFLATFSKTASSAYDRYADIKKAEHEVAKAELAARKELALATQQAELKLGHEQVKATSQWFKHITFIMWFGPFITTTIFPSHGVAIFENWKLMPEWYAQSCVALMFILWGVQVGKAYIQNIFANASQFFARRREFKIRRKLMFDVLRSTKGTISQAEVDLYERVMDGYERTINNEQKQEESPNQ